MTGGDRPRASPALAVALALREPPPWRLERLAAFLAAVDARAAAADPGPPAPTHLLLTPLGRARAAGLRATLEGAGVRLLGRLALPRFTPIASALQSRRGGPDLVRRAARYEAAWDALFPRAGGEAWFLAPGSHALAAALKPGVRRCLPALRVVLPGGEEANLRAFHLADPGAALAEGRRLRAALALLGTAPGSGAAPAGGVGRGA